MNVKLSVTTNKSELFLSTTLAFNMTTELEFAVAALYYSSPYFLYFESTLCAKSSTASSLFFGYIFPSSLRTESTQSSIGA